MWSPEARVLVRPAAVYRELVQENQPGGLASRVLLLAFTLGCLVSALAAPRLTPRIVLDGAVSFASIPILELGALAVVLSKGSRRQVPYRQAAGWFFVGNAPWLAWMIAIALCSSVVSSLFAPAFIAVRDTSLIVPFLYSLRTDLHFFRQVSGRSVAGAWWDAVVFRGLSWTLFVAYFFGTSIYGQIVPAVVGMVR